MQLWRPDFELDGILAVVPLLTNKDTSLIVRGRLYSSCVQKRLGLDDIISVPQQNRLRCCWHVL